MKREQLRIRQRSYLWLSNSNALFLLIVFFFDRAINLYELIVRMLLTPSEKAEGMTSNYC